jgi:hypothetical protein
MCRNTSRIFCIYKSTRSLHEKRLRCKVKVAVPVPAMKAPTVWMYNSTIFRYFTTTKSVPVSHWIGHLQSVRTFWSREKSLASAGNLSTNTWLSSPQPSRFSERFYSALCNPLYQKFRCRQSEIRMRCNENPAATSNAVVYMQGNVYRSQLRGSFKMSPESLYL